MAFYLNFKSKYFVTTSNYSNFRKGLGFYRPISVGGFLRKSFTYYVYPNKADSPKTSYTYATKQS